MKPETHIAYCSPANSTRHVAEVIKSTIIQQSGSVHVLDLAHRDRHDEFKERLKASAPNDCLFIGSPVYRDMAAPPMIEFLDSLPAVNGCSAALFIAWGGAFSGIALWQMGRELTRKGFNLIGGAKVLGVHSMMWSHPEPVGQGRPNADDDKAVSEFTQAIFERLSENKTHSLPLEALDYNPEAHTADLKKNLGQPWQIIPKTVDEDQCTQCGVCEEVCPVGAIKLTDYPAFSKSCFDCFNCIRLCPEDAIGSTVPFAKIHKMIFDRVKKFNEKPHTQVFMP